jgi:hypothetical protein
VSLFAAISRIQVLTKVPRRMETRAIETGKADRVADILCEAIEIPAADERNRYLDQACGDDAELRRRVEKLIKHHFAAGSFLETPAGFLPKLETPPLGNESHDPSASTVEAHGTMIGRYKLLEQIGEGGMGVVYLAEQRQPVRRHVALKIIKPGMDSRQVIARFEAERQALALMDHPNIARILDAGLFPLRIGDCGLRIAD